MEDVGIFVPQRLLKNIEDELVEDLQYELQGKLITNWS
jgi:hypothetical protein